MLSAHPSFTSIELTAGDRIATVTFNHPPLNLLDSVMMDDLARLGLWLEQQESISVAVFESADEAFFIAHADLTMLEGLKLPDAEDVREPSLHQTIVDRFAKLPQLTIGKIRGVARGGGSEFLLALDLRYGSRERAILGQPEVALGFPPGCGATQRLPRLVGRDHAIEAILGGMDYPAAEAERIGWLTRALPDRMLDDFVARFARQVASYPRQAIVEAKAAINQAHTSLSDGLSFEFAAFLRAFALNEARSRVRTALSSGFQTREIEAQALDRWLLELNNKDQTGQEIS